MILLIRSDKNQFTILNVVRIEKKANPYRMVKSIIIPYVSREDGEAVSAGEIDLTQIHVEILPD